MANFRTKARAIDLLGRNQIANIARAIQNYGRMVMMHMEII